MDSADASVSAGSINGADADVGQTMGIDRLIAIARDTVDELGNDVDKFPRLTALTSFGVGLTLGFALGRQTR